METLLPKSGFIPEARLPNTRPDTPPYTPHRSKRRLERADSPASSIQPTETSSPTKKAAKRRAVVDNVKVDELVEGDVGYHTDIDVVYPDELEEAETESDGFESYTDDDDEGETSGLTRRLSRLRCGDDTEVDFEKERRQRHMHRRNESRLFKRTHSQSVKGSSEVMDAETADPEAMDDHDNRRSQRRLRRRMRGPLDSDNEASSSIYGANDSIRSSMEPLSRPMTPLHFSDHEKASHELMDVDDT